MSKVVSNRHQHECDILKTTIEIVEEENVVLKTKLAGIVHSNKMDPKLLDQVEYLHSQLVLLDEKIRRYKQELASHLKLYQLHKNTHEIPSTELLKDQEKLRIKLERLKVKFIALKKDLEKFDRTG